MPNPADLPWVDMIGYSGGALTIWGMFRKTMIPLRLGAIGGNVGFLIFGLLAPSYPTLITHAVLLPLNTIRMFQMMRLVREIRESSGQDNSLEPLLPFMRREQSKAGTVLFRKDYRPDRMIVIHSGTVLLEELGTRCGEGDVLGEIGVFTPDNHRTCTAVCETDCVFHTLSNEAMVQLYYQNPRFGMFIVRIIVQRLLKNWRDANAATKPMPM
jgi:hypothetical protein